MRLFARLSILLASLILGSCVHEAPNPIDPYEAFNRKIYKFNQTVDTLALKPVARFYKTILPPQIRIGINNAYNNVAMLPTAANDLLQGDWRHAIKDSWRFFINSTFGVAGLFDVADKSFGLPPHYNDLGLTFAKWGDKNSPYLVVPLLGPSTIRDAMSIPFDYMLTPFPYLRRGAAIYSLAALRYIDLRSQLLETDRLFDEAFDQYSFIRDAYLQHRHFLIFGEEITHEHENEADSLYVDEETASG